MEILIEVCECGRCRAGGMYSWSFRHGCATKFCESFFSRSYFPCHLVNRETLISSVYCIRSVWWCFRSFLGWIHTQTTRQSKSIVEQNVWLLKSLTYSPLLQSDSVWTKFNFKIQFYISFNRLAWTVKWGLIDDSWNSPRSLRSSWAPSF